LAEVGIEIAGIGEILMDKFENGDSTLGGAPLNVVFHLHQLLRTLNTGEARMISRVGSDDDGRHILANLRVGGLDTHFITTDWHHATGSARVFAHGGAAEYEIAQNVAWDAIPPSKEMNEFAERVSAVVFGSLAQRSEKSRKTIRQFVSQVKGERLYDVNLRRNATDGVAGYSAEIIRRSLELATVVKLNGEELVEVARLLGLTSDGQGEERMWARMEELKNIFGLKLVALTRGAKGALVLGESERWKLPDSDLPQENVHPVGAGDSFTAGLLYGLARGWSLRACLELADTLSRWVVTNLSATPSMTPQIRAEIVAVVAKAEMAVVH